MQRKAKFPLLGDNEPVLVQAPQMNLYEEADLISNIRGPYQEKEYGEAVADTPIQSPSGQSDFLDQEAVFPPLFQSPTSHFSRKKRHDKSVGLSKPQAGIRTQGQIAREKAREDLRQKRSATYLKDEKPISRPLPKETRVMEEKQTPANPLSHLADRLRQTHYIVADLPATYPLGKQERQEDVQRPKNSYDFLKKSQVYNYPEAKRAKERQLAQELNLTKIEEE